MADETPRESGEELVRADVLRAAESGDLLAFAALAQRMGSLDEARQHVRNRGIVRMAERAAAPSAAPLEPHLRLVESERDTGADPSADPTMFGHFAVFNDWTEIDSMFEGNFLERIAPGAFKKTFRENRDQMKSLFQHGHDPQIGDKPLGTIEQVSEDTTGAYYEVQLLDAPYVRSDILPGIRAGLYGASFRFQVMREEFDNQPSPSAQNPAGLPERTIKEARVFEFGPVTFPAYPSATAGVRSTSSDANGDGDEIPDAPSPPDAAITAPRETSAAQAPRFRTREEWQAWLKA